MKPSRVLAACVMAVGLSWPFLAVLNADEVIHDVNPPTVILSRGGPQRTGSVSGSHLPEHPVVLWTTPLQSSPGSPLLAEGYVYVGDSRGSLYAIDLDNGSTRWRYQGNTQIFEAPAKFAGNIYFTSRNGLSFLSQANGTKRLTSSLVGNATESSPLILGDRIIVGSTKGKIFAVGLKGNLIWQHDVLEDAPPSPPGFDADQGRAGDPARPRSASSDGTTVFVPIFDQSRIVAIDVRSGRRLWSFQTKGWIFGAPTVTDRRLYFGSQDKSFYCLDKRRKTLLWSFPTASRIEAGAAFREGSVYFGSCDGRFYRVDAETGKEVWSYQTPQVRGRNPAIYSAPICTEDAVYFGSFDGHVYCLGIDQGELRWRIEAVPGGSVSSDVLTDGRRLIVGVYANPGGDGQNAIVAIGEKTRDHVAEPK